MNHSDFRLCARISSGLRLCPADVRENNPLKACPSRPRVKFGIGKNDAALSHAIFR
jgi:hypothetical protein